jgi:hypothetical protein
VLEETHNFNDVKEKKKVVLTLSGATGGKGSKVVSCSSVIFSKPQH